MHWLCCWCNIMCDIVTLILCLYTRWCIFTTGWLHTVLFYRQLFIFYLFVIVMHYNSTLSDRKLSAIYNLRLLHVLAYIQQQVRMYYRSGIGAGQMLCGHSPGHSGSIFCMKWHHGRHLETRPSVDANLREENSDQNISSQSIWNDRAFSFFSKWHHSSHYDVISEIWLCQSKWI